MRTLFLVILLLLWPTIASEAHLTLQYRPTYPCCIMVGPKGGYWLDKPGGQIYLREVVTK